MSCSVLSITSQVAKRLAMAFYAGKTEGNTSSLLRIRATYYTASLLTSICLQGW